MMPKTRPPYSPELRRQMDDLVRAGRDPADLAREFEPTAQSICHWVTQAISMDGRGAWRDNVFVERLWRLVKYEEVYLHAYASVAEARTSISRYPTFYNARGPHSSLDARTPDRAYFDHLPLAAAC